MQLFTSIKAKTKEFILQAKAKVKDLKTKAWEKCPQGPEHVLKHWKTDHRLQNLSSSAKDTEIGLQDARKTRTLLHCLPSEPVVPLADGGSFGATDSELAVADPMADDGSFGALALVEDALFSGQSEVLLGSNTSGQIAFLFTGKMPDSRNPDCAVATVGASLHAASKSLKICFFVWFLATCLPQMFSTMYCPVMFEGS